MKTNIRKNYQLTVYACYIAYIVQGIVNNVNPILFTIYSKRLGITLDRIGWLIAANFGIQIMIDLAAAKYVDKIGYRICIVGAHIFVIFGLIGIGCSVMFGTHAFLGVFISTLLNGVGGGLLEVLVSPIVEAAPSEEKDKAMSMLHSFYCWGCVGFIAISTGMLHFMGESNWNMLPIAWAVIPLFNILAFLYVPVGALVEEEERISIKVLCRQKIFWQLVLLMVCAGASEMAMSQWASYFAENGLSVSKQMGDIFGACFFCFMMGLSRLFYGRNGEKIPLQQFMLYSCLLCVFGYCIAVFSPYAILGLIGCGICGLSVGILWPGSYSIAAKECKAGGTALFAILALAGDLGCITGPEVVSLIATATPRYGLRAGLFVAIVFPVLMLIGVLRVKEKGR